MSSIFGRLDRGVDTVEPPEPEPDPPVSPAVIRRLHVDFVRQKRRALVTASPLLLLAGFAWAAAISDPAHFGGLAFLAFAAVAAIGQMGYEWLQLRRADPLELHEREQREAALRKVRDAEHAERSAAVRPVVSVALAVCLVIVTLVQFQSAPFVKGLTAAALVKPAVRAGEWWRLLTASYLHGSAMHLVSNAAGLFAIGRVIEIYDQRMRIPLVYLAGAIGGNVLSTLLSSQPAVGASGGVLALAGYLVVVAGRLPGGPPAWVRREIWSIIGSTAFMGLVAFFFIDNAAHLGGVLAGALIGAAAARRRHTAMLDRLGWAAAGILLAGALFTITKLR